MACAYIDAYCVYRKIHVCNYANKRMYRKLEILSRVWNIK